MHKTEKKEYGGQSAIPRDTIRKRGRKRIYFNNNNNNNNNLNTIGVDDLPPVVTNSSIEDFMLTDSSYLSNPAEKAKEEKPKQKLHGIG
jgi:hypothetical protein